MKTDLRYTADNRLFSGWHVMIPDNVETHARYRFYGKLSEFDDEDLEGMTEVPIEKWIAEDYLEILGNTFENWNYHYEASYMPDLMENVIKDSNLSDEQAVTIARNFTIRVTKALS